MVHNVLSDAAALAARHYAAPRAPVSSDEWPPGEWSTLVRIVLEHGRLVRKDRDWSWVAETLLETAHDAAEQTASRLAEVLDSAGHPGNKAALLRALAQWWQRRVAESDALAVFRSRALEHWQEDLRAIRGVSWELADRILLIVGGCAVYPLDRGSMRIAHRHGWMGAGSEYGDWQAFFGSAARDSQVDLLQLWQWNVKLGRDFCGRQPDCEDCPLKSLLPARGPVPLGDEA